MAPSHPAEHAAEGVLLRPAQLLALQPGLATTERLCVAFSGGLDSTVLLHMLWQLHKEGSLGGAVRVLHIHHGLQVVADGWQAHCEQLCTQWQLPLTTIRIQVSRLKGESLETAARRARYAAFSANLQHNEWLLQAHHADDQAETLLLRLLRGSGAQGLGAIPQQRPLSPGLIVRPLLQCSRSELLAYSQQHALTWIEDPSNADQHHDRNFLRHSVLPLLRSRWPAASTSLSRSAVLQQEATQLLGELARLDLATMSLASPNQLPLKGLRELDAARCRNLLRYWVTQQPPELQGAQLAFDQLDRCVDELIRTDSPDYRWLGWQQHGQGWHLHSYRNRLYLLKAMPETPVEQHWQTSQSLQLPAPLGELQWLMPGEPQTFRVAFRSGGERVPKSDGHHQSLSHYWQQRAVPPWLRDHVPLLYHAEELVAIGDSVMPATNFAKRFDTHNLLHWQRSLLLCGW